MRLVFPFDHAPCPALSLLLGSPLPPVLCALPPGGDRAAGRRGADALALQRLRAPGSGIPLEDPAPGAPGPLTPRGGHAARVAHLRAEPPIPGARGDGPEPAGCPRGGPGALLRQGVRARQGPLLRGALGLPPRWDRMALRLWRAAPLARTPPPARAAHAGNLPPLTQNAARGLPRGKTARGFSRRQGLLRAAHGLQAGAAREGLTQRILLVGALPGELFLGAAEVPVRGGLLVDGPQQVQVLDNLARTQAEHLAHRQSNLLFRHGGRAERLHHHAHRLGDPDGVGDLHLAPAGQTRGHHVLGDVAPHVRRGAVHLGRVLAREGAAAVTAHAAVGVDDDLPARHARVAHGATHHEAAGGVDEELGLLVDELGRQRPGDDVLAQRLVDLLVGDLLGVLRGHHHGVDAHRAPLAVLHRDLALAVRTDPRVRLAADLGQPPGEGVGIVDGGRHQLRRLIAGIAEHHSLVAGTLVLLVVHAAGDVLALALDGHHHATGVAVIAHGAVGVADAADGPTDDLGDIDVAVRGHLARDDGESGLDQGLHGDARLRILGDDGIQHTIGDLIGDLVRVAFSDGFGREQEVGRHVFSEMTGRRKPGKD
ncbi:hypothetical protein STIAU_6032 [Stigmatella aurantiaca DW4/3-1]|uniref:Uncharacterized protein n=1 Tax=Stigmatella aurantiaca (strain DW4/3-1) TaxID=378806 RepID=Q09A96_STIAD|nr:hypothetical protein STIAU_6032 [Stigmatella aurantiaca DW4/3-1]